MRYIDVLYNNQSVSHIGATVADITPMPRAQRRVTTVEVPGRSGFLHITERGAPSIERVVSLSVRNIDALLRVNEWCAPSGDLFVTNTPDYFFRAYQHAEIDWVKASQNVYKAQIAFEVSPYWYAQNGLTPIAYTEPGGIYNSLPTESEPLIQVDGTGNITLYINNRAITFRGLNGSVIIDSEMQMAYWDNHTMTHIMSGDYPILQPGISKFDWIGNIKKLTITPRWRML